MANQHALDGTVIPPMHVCAHQPGLSCPGPVESQRGAMVCHRSHFKPYLGLLIFHELLVGSYHLVQAAFQHLLPGYLGQSMAADPVDFLTQAEQEILHVPGWLEEPRMGKVVSPVPVCIEGHGALDPGWAYVLRRP